LIRPQAGRQLVLLFVNKKEERIPRLFAAQKLILLVTFGVFLFCGEMAT
jgi:hypothetical protein